MTNEKVDVVIVGAGASGSVYASVLAKAGKKVEGLHVFKDCDGDFMNAPPSAKLGSFEVDAAGRAWKLVDDYFAAELGVERVR